MTRHKPYWPAVLAALPLVHLVAACNFERHDGALANPGTTLIFCDIEADRHCASNEDIVRGIDIAKPFESGFWLDKSHPIALDYSAAAVAACGGPMAVVYRGAFPTGTPVCMAPGSIGPAPAVFRTINAACKVWCSEQGFKDPDGTPYDCDSVAWQSHGVPQENDPAGPGFQNGCTDTGMLLPFFDDTRRVRPVHNVLWAATIGVNVTGNNLVKTASPGWARPPDPPAAGAVSSEALVSGNGAVLVTASEPNSLRMFGLGNGALATHFEDVEFGLLMTQAGTLLVFESGVFRGSFCGYEEWDRLEVAVEEGFVVYKKNDAILYKSTVFPSYPLHAKAAFNFTGATIRNAQVTF